MACNREEQKFRLLTVHNMIWSVAMSLAGGFVAAYLLRMGFSVPQTLCIYGSLLGARLLVRVLALPVIRRIGLQRAFLLGAGISAFQFLPLVRADEPIWLIAWIALVSVGECVYWPIFHGANASLGGNG